MILLGNPSDKGFGNQAKVAISSVLIVKKLQKELVFTRYNNCYQLKHFFEPVFKFFSGMSWWGIGIIAVD